MQIEDMKSQVEVYKRGDGKFCVRIWDLTSHPHTTMVDMVVDSAHIERNVTDKTLRSPYFKSGGLGGI